MWRREIVNITRMTHKNTPYQNELMTNKKQQKIDFLSLDNDSKVEHNK